MKYFYCFLFILLSPTADAEIFKCTDSIGKTFYQDKPCPETAKSIEMEIEPIDQNQYDQARKRLSEELKDYAEIEALKAHQNLREREVSAMERNAKANEDMADANRLEQEEQAYQPDNTYYDGYYYLPGYYTGFPRYPRYGNYPPWKDYPPRHGKRPPPQRQRPQKLYPGNK